VALDTRAFAPVFPCFAVDTPTSDIKAKQPATTNGFHDATTDEATIRRWWVRNPEHLVGIPAAGLVVVDLDVKPGVPCTWTWWQTTCARYGWAWDRDLMVFTPGNGVHVYFEAPDGVEVRNSTSKLAPGVDVRGDGGYVIAPGSRLPDGRCYELVNDPEGMHEAPEWLLDLIAKATAPPTRQVPSALGTSSVGHGTAYGVRALESELGRLALAVDGTRNDTLHKAAVRCGQLAAGGQLDAHHAHDQLYAVALRIGLTDTETEATIESGMTFGAGQPRTPAP
jgi:putative DNA primase/helicase